MHRCHTTAACFAIGWGLLVATAAPAQDTPRRLEIQPGDRIALVGNSLAERMRHFGYFEALVHLRFPRHELQVRNFGWPCDEVANRQRPSDYTAIDDPLNVFAPNVLLCFFGFNESFAGPEGIEQFEADYRRYLAQLRDQFGQENTPPRLALVTPTAYEPTGNPLMPSGDAENANLRAYAEAIERVAEAENLPVVDLFTPTRAEFRAQPGVQFTTNGAHLNDAGYRLIAPLLDASLFEGSHPSGAQSPFYEPLRRAVTDLQWHHGHDYRMVNGWYVYGSRSRPLDVDTFPAEYAKIRKMVADRDRVVWALARGESPPPVDDVRPELADPPTAFGTKPYSEPDELRILTPDEAIEAMTVADGYRVETFADETEFPELANPVQMNFDNRGRLWVSCMPTYPQWRPGEPPPSDRLLIFEDTDHDGRADTVKVFADELHCPNGFEFWNGGVLVTSQPRVLFLKDTDGDDRADVQQIVLDGFATDDTHHAIGAYEWTTDGRLVMLEGVAMSTTVETPWGPFRNKNRSAAYALDPGRSKLERYMSPCFANAWCFTHNEWGQPFVGDGTSAVQHWATPLTGAEFRGRRGNDEFIEYSGERLRPALGSGFISSRHFPESAQGNFFFACVINMNGIPQFRVEEDGSGYRGTRIDDLVNSTDENFRPGDPQIGPDGALYFVDWHNPLIGHMQYSQRDPNRDHRHGRVYRLSAVDRPTVEPVTQADKSVTELLTQLGEYEARTRYRARRELRDRPTDEVVAAVGQLQTTLDPADPLHDRLLTESLWVLEGHHVVRRELIDALLRAETPDARAAAIRTVANQREMIDNPLDILAPLVDDPHPRVRLETVRALSFFPTRRAFDLAVRVVNYPLDRELRYTLESTLGALRPVWEAAANEGVDLAGENAEIAQLMARVASNDFVEQQAAAWMKRLSNSDKDIVDNAAERILRIADLHGSRRAGARVFKRSCHACHRVGDEGADYGPNLSDVGIRLRRHEIIESIVDPNATIDDKYKATNVITVEGKIHSGLVTRDDDEGITLVLGDGKVVDIPHDDIDDRQQVDVSSMPGGLHEAMSASEFLDLAAFLSAQKTPPRDATQ